MHLLPALVRKAQSFTNRLLSSNNDETGIRNLKTSKSSTSSSLSHFYVGSMWDDGRPRAARSYTSSPDSPFSLRSSFTRSAHLFFGLPLLPLPCTSVPIAIFPTYYSSLLASKSYYARTSADDDGLTSLTSAAFLAALGSRVTDRCPPTPLADGSHATRTARLLRDAYAPIRSTLALLCPQTPATPTGNIANRAAAALVRHVITFPPKLSRWYRF